MRDEVRRDAQWSAGAFAQLVWPEIAASLGGGVLRPVELADSDLARDLDAHAGIDAFQVIRDASIVRGIASRVQTTNDAWPTWETFTVRYRRSSGTSTEFEKRLRAIEDTSLGALWPHLTVHAYLDATKTRCRSVAIIETEMLYRFAAHGEAELRARLGRELQHGDSNELVSVKRVGADGNLFLAINWWVAPTTMPRFNFDIRDGFEPPSNDRRRSR